MGQAAHGAFVRSPAVWAARSRSNPTAPPRTRARPRRKSMVGIEIMAVPLHAARQEALCGLPLSGENELGMSIADFARILSPGGYTVVGRRWKTGLQLAV